MDKHQPIYSLDKLKEIDDSTEFIRQVLRIFLDTVPSNSKAMVKACAEENWEQVYFFAHKMKANINLLSITAIMEDIKFVEQNAKGMTNLNEIPGKVKFIDEVVDKAGEDMLSLF